ncbi:MAG TPA: PKD domain-containing protein, partial [Agriterribacter sp.]|nr:PKD domain-containing protein [Agriterribacter sp.]
PVVDLGPDAAICSGSSITLDAGVTGATYSWSTGATTQTISVSTAGTYSVTVTKNGCSDSDTKVITVTAPPVVDLGPDAAICSGSSVTLDAGNPGATYLWNTGAITKTISVSTAGTYSVTVTNGGCSGTDSKVITVNTPGFAVDLGPDQAMCPGGQIILDAGVTGATYQWGSTYLPFVYAGETGKTTVALGVGKYWVRVSQGGCTVTDTIIITAKPAVEAKFNYTLTGSCSPILASFVDASVECSGSIMERTWDFGDSSPILTGNNLTPTHSYAQPGTYHVTLTVKTSAGVVNTYGEDVFVSGTAIPVDLGNDTTICAGSTIILDAGTHTGATYDWAPDGATTQTISVNASGTYIVTVTSGGCKAIDAINVTVAPTLTVDLGKDTTICAGSLLTLDAGNPGATYLWNTGETTRTITANSAQTYIVTVANGSCSGSGSIKVDISTTLPVTLGNDTTICTGSSITLNAGYPGALYTWGTGEVSQTLTVNAAGTYNVTVNKNGCIGNAEIEVTQAYAPSVVNLGNDSTICFGYGVVLDAGNAGASYLWSTGETTQTITAASSGTYSVSVTGCGKTVSDAINLDMANLPIPTITQVGIELVASQADTYQWYKNGILIPDATDKKYKPRGYGTYKVAVTSTGSACMGESNGYFFVPNGDIYLGDIRIKLSPNPGNGLAKLVFSKLPPKPVNVTVYDRVGRRILHTTMMNTVNEINLTAYAKGEYFVECILGDDRIIIPMITQ